MLFPKIFCMTVQSLWNHVNRIPLCYPSQNNSYLSWKCMRVYKFHWTRFPEKKTTTLTYLLLLFGALKLSKSTLKVKSWNFTVEFHFNGSSSDLFSEKWKKRFSAILSILASHRDIKLNYLLKFYSCSYYLL